MRRTQIAALLTAIAALLSADQPPRAQSTVAPTAALSAKLRAHRSAHDNLELGGDLAGVATGESRFLSREDLLAVSQPMTIAPDDGNFHVSTSVRGVRLEDLARALGAPAGDMVIAICKDKYRGHYPRAYLAAHPPVLVVELNGKSLSDLPKDKEGDDPGPYLIAHARFPRTSKNPVENDEPQIPWGVVRLEFRDEKTVFGTIASRGTHAGDQAVQDGFKIAQQNCFRCHNNGVEGGSKSGVTWMVLAALAANSPQFFIEYVRDPKSKNPNTQMAASPAYDDATMNAVVAYFKTFAPAGGH
jgi:mono/diheme cytochrome c family protein